MPPVSSIARLPDELRAEIDRRLADGRLTLDEITAFVRASGGDVSRSALGRRKQRLDKILERSRQAHEIAEVVARHFAGASESDMVRGNVEILHALIQRAISEAEGVEAKDAMFFSSALEKLAKTLEAETRLSASRAKSDPQAGDGEAAPPLLRVEFVRAAPVSDAASAETPPAPTNPNPEG